MSDDNKATNLKVAKNNNEMNKLICENCHNDVTGSFCSQCGQSVESTLKYFWTVILHLLDDIFSFDSRASRTLIPLMLKPGFLTNEYIAGRRVHYVPPLRLYLFISIIFFLSLNLLTSNSIFEKQNFLESNHKVTEHLKKLNKNKVEAIRDNDLITAESIEKEVKKYTDYQRALSNKDAILAAGVTDEIVLLEFKKMRKGGKLKDKDEQELTNAIEQLKLINEGKLTELVDEQVTFSNNADGTVTFDFLSVENNKKLNDFTELLEKKATKAFNSDPTPLFKESVSKLPQLMFLVLPLFAALLKIMYMFSKRLYMEHLTVALHSHSFIFLTILIVQLADWLYDYLDETSTLLRSLLEYGSYAALIWLPIYLFLMQKRVYKQGKLLTIVKYNVVGMLYMMLLGFTAFVAFIWGLTDTQL
ncbi:DUF3667 domain-containing protein [Cognaticolwellia mytili]|uniref:DUF3667 domain-containing protein n=1 Tax=Cognaticolwellia mytili TaxID=1888913 RepID=UPI000A173716|nr:DUF3667 domain-containing protein [Cognaticolwellia mytili]